MINLKDLGVRAIGVPKRVKRMLPPSDSKTGRTQVTIARDAFGTVALNLSSVLLNFVTGIVLSRILGRRGFGYYVYVLAWSSVLTIPALFGSVQLLIRNVTYYRTQQSWGLIRGIIRRCRVAVLTASLVVVAIAAVAGTALMAGDDGSPQGPYLLGLLLVPIVAMINVNQAEMIAFQRILPARVPETVAYPAMYLALIIALEVLAGDLSPTYAVLLNVAAALAAFSLGVILTRSTIPPVVRNAAPTYDRSAWIRSTPPLLLIAALPVLTAHSGTILLGIMDHVDSAAVFSAAVRWAAFTGFLQWASGFPLGPVIVRMQAQDDTKRLERLLSTTATAVFVLSAPIAAGLLVFGGQALRVYGAAFGSGRAALSILVIGEVINIACGLVGVILIMTGHETTVARFGAIAVLGNVALCLLLIPHLGVEGAAVARSVTTAALNVALLWAVWQRLGICPAALLRFSSRRAPLD